VAEGRAFADRGITDHRRGSREAVAAAATRRLAAILAADVAGYSRLMGADEEGTLNRLKAHRRELVDPKIREHHGRIVKTTGDGMLVEFSSVVDAVRCAVEIQRAMVDGNAETTEDKRITFRIGINLGDIIVDADDIYGDGVNIAARLEALAEPGGICISRTVRDHIGDRLPYTFEDIGPQSVKNIAQPVHAYALNATAVASLPEVTMPPQQGASRRRPRLAVLLASLVAAMGIGVAVWWAWPKGNSSALPIQAFVATGVQRPPVADAKSAPRLSIVVLPFSNLSNDPDQDYFADGITDDLTTDLSRITGSFVIARTTAFTYKGKPIDVKQIGHELGVRYVLEGSVRRTGDQVRVNAQLIDAETGAHLWADQFDTNLANLAKAQSEITGRLAWTLNIELLRDASHRIEHENAAASDARDLVMRGWAWWYAPQTPKTAQEALRAFEHALEMDPRSAEARIGIARIVAGRLANLWSSTSFQQNAVQQDVARVELLLAEAIESDPNQPMAYAIMGILRRLQSRLAESRLALERAISLDPNFEWANMQLGWTLLFLGGTGDAIARGEKSLRLSPRDPNIFWRYELLGWCQLLTNHVDEAIDLFIKARTANPRVWNFSYALAGALGLKGDLEGGKSALAESLKLKPEVNSLAQWYAFLPWTSKTSAPKFWALEDKTLNEGLRRIGFPEE
jgi:TolB-like protein/class 3 adenylate cyclase/Tfp pilus assembly protein PilF